MITRILLDIEGTTTPISFVYDVLFPYARQHAGRNVGADDVRSLREEYDADVRKGMNPPKWSMPPVAYVHWLMDEDRKSTALKNLQGRIWLEGYERGQLRGQVFEDVPPAFERWKKAGIDIRIYSSGSILAQKLLFSTTTAGDLTRYLKGYFDTTTGGKNEAKSYAAIASAFGCEPGEILFVSDLTSELEAAGLAGMQTALSVRPGNKPQIPGEYLKISSFDELWFAPM